MYSKLTRADNPIAGNATVRGARQGLYGFCGEEGARGGRSPWGHSTMLTGRFDFVLCCPVFWLFAAEVEVVHDSVGSCLRVSTKCSDPVVPSPSFRCPRRSGILQNCRKYQFHSAKLLGIDTIAATRCSILTWQTINLKVCVHSTEL